MSARSGRRATSTSLPQSPTFLPCSERPTSTHSTCPGSSQITDTSFTLDVPSYHTPKDEQPLRSRQTSSRTSFSRRSYAAGEPSRNSLPITGHRTSPPRISLRSITVSVMNPLFLSPFFFLLNQTFNLDFPISCGRQTKDVSLGECGHYGWTRVSTPPKPPTLIGPPLLIPTDACTQRWLLPPAQKA